MAFLSLLVAVYKQAFLRMVNHGYFSLYKVVTINNPTFRQCNMSFLRACLIHLLTGSKQ